MSDRPRGANRSTLRLVALAGATLIAGASACESEPPSSGTSDTTTIASTPPTTTAAPIVTTTTSTVPVDLLASCVEHAKFQAFTGNEFWAGIWNDAGRTDAGMRGACEFLASGQPGWLEEVHATWLELQRVSAVTPTTTAAP